jgi:prepilin-type processing-associated H-X9-DG protein
LLPALNRARESAATVKCASNLRSVGQGFAMYLAENKSTFPAAYRYYGPNKTLGPISQEPGEPTNGYIHWSWFIYGKGGTNQGAFQCPSIENGGLPPTNPAPGKGDPGQVNEFPGVVDDQVERIAYTVNEAIVPRNKFLVRGTPSAGARNSGVVAQRFVKAGQIGDASGTILATEFWADYRIVTDEDVVKSHRPVHGFRGLSGDELNFDRVAPSTTGTARVYQRVQTVAPWVTAGSPVGSRLEWVGRNHGRRRGNDAKNGPKTNFLYVDGHVETKIIEETLSPFQWGSRFYSYPDLGLPAN